jgi:hypothetical protein
MTVGFVAYIDESGDTGIEQVKGKRLFGGQSEWLVLSCFLVRAQHDSEVSSWVREITGQFRNHQRPGLHFADLIPVKKVIACRMIATKPCRFFVVMSNKKNIEGYRNRNLDDNNKAWPYWFLSRLLLERVTEFCEGLVPEAKRGQVKLRVTFARRGGLRYADFAGYLRKLQKQSRAGTLVLGKGDLRWSLIDLDEITVLDHAERAGLQLADIGAGAFFQAVERNRPGDCIPEYAELLHPVVGKDAYGNRLGFGIKTMPLLHEMNLWPQQRAVFEFYGYDPDGWQAPGS